MGVKSIIKNLLKRNIDKSLPSPNATEKELISQLRNKFLKMFVDVREDMSASEREWAQNSNSLREQILKKDPRGFLRWNVISNTMFISDAPYIKTELQYLQSKPDWKTKWEPAIKETSIGNPVPYIDYPASSANLIHHAYHIARFEETVNREIKNVELVFEFGGGYGSMCRLLHNLGFKGLYIILDLPEFSELQKYFLNSLGFSVKTDTTTAVSENAIFCVSKVDELKKLLANNLSSKKEKLFLATWSLSETPKIVRESVLPFISEFESFLIAYQDSFGEVNNLEYFDQLKQSYKKVTWDSWPIKHLQGNNYLMGATNQTSV